MDKPVAAAALAVSTGLILPGVQPRWETLAQLLLRLLNPTIHVAAPPAQSSVGQLRARDVHCSLAMPCTPRADPGCNTILYMPVSAQSVISPANSVMEGAKFRRHLSFRRAFYDSKHRTHPGKVTRCVSIFCCQQPVFLIYLLEPYFCYLLQSLCQAVK
jgi:hypothetical protein